MIPELRWFGDHGFFPARPDGVYDAPYFEKYEGYARTELGERLNRARLDLVAARIGPDVPLVDVGIGSGQFVAARPGTFGYDVNPAGVRWLRGRERFFDPYAGRIAAMSFWDSLEHIEDPTILLARCDAWAFVSLPLFTDRAHVLRSKHFRPDEHYWYFTRDGFVRFMAAQGFALVEENDVESRLGREDIGSFTFRRTRAA